MSQSGQMVLLALLLVPVPLVILVAVLRGYTISIHLVRRRPPPDD